MTASLIRDTVKTFYLETGQNIDRFVPSSPTVPSTFRRTILYQRPLSRCNLYLITVGNILDLKSFLVKYRNIKKTSTLPPRPGGRRKWFSFHEFFKATGTTRKSPTTVTVFHTLPPILPTLPSIFRSLFHHLYHCLDRGLQSIVP